MVTNNQDNLRAGADAREAAYAKKTAEAKAAAAPLTLDQVKQYAAKPSSIPGAGSAQQVQKVYDALSFLKEGVKSGTVPYAAYFEYAQPLVKQAQQTAMALGSGGGSGWESVKGVWNQLVGEGFTSPDGGKAVSPFNAQEFTKLPNNVLPTQKDIDSGYFDPINMPVQRIQKEPVPQVNPGVDGSMSAVPTQTPTQAATNTTPGVSTPNAQTGDAPVFTANPNNPSPYGGLQSANSQASVDAQKIANEAALQQQLATQAANERAGKRKGYLNDLSGLITQQNSLAQTSANALQQAGLQAEQQDLGDYKGIQDAYNQARNSALSRQFSVEDYSKQVATGKEMGAEYAKLTPQAPSTKSQIEVAAAGGAASGLAAKK